MRSKAQMLNNSSEKDMKIRQMAVAVLTGLSLVMLFVVDVAPASGVIGGTVDGDGHSYVGAIDARQIRRKLTPSGVLISPTVFLTAGHVTRFWDDVGVSRARVTFDPVVNESSAWHWGTVHTNPSYDPSRFDDSGDLGVVVFDEPVSSVTPAELPTQNLLDRMGPKRLNESTFTSVGYGVSRTTGGSDGGGTSGLDFNSAGTRKIAHLGFQSLTSAWLRLEGHEDGQPCTGDSGSPALLGNSDVIAGILAIIPNGCGHERQVEWEQRLDTPSARAFLGQFVRLPELLNDRDGRSNPG